jgi:EAL domain-containing protein (putative c-di-GMP-specific phosphodiesterase class I)
MSARQLPEPRVRHISHSAPIMPIAKQRSRTNANSAPARHTISVSDIAHALAQDQFNFFYQPKISLLTGQIIGAEALIRWIKPDGTVIPPEAFIPLAEQSALIKDITRHMFPKLLRDISTLQAVNAQLAISFNVSARDFDDNVFTDIVLASLTMPQYHCTHLQIELTETIPVGNDATIRRNLGALREAGLTLAMDDFGKGYSSLDTLSKCAFTTIKLDQDIISRMFDSDKSLTMVDSLIRMAHELGMSVVAEGVETREQYRHLLRTGCTEAQGYWISQPLPLDQYITFVNAGFRWSGLPTGLIHMTIMDHMQWRKRLIGAVIDAASCTESAAQRQRCTTPPLSCSEFAPEHWYHEIRQVFQDQPLFLHIERLSRKLYETGETLVALVHNGGDMQAIAAHLGKLSDQSNSVIVSLQILEEESLIHMHAVNDDRVSRPCVH